MSSDRSPCCAYINASENPPAKKSDQIDVPTDEEGVKKVADAMTMTSEGCAAPLGILCLVLF